jgi:hypothetical protein
MGITGGSEPQSQSGGHSRGGEGPGPGWVPAPGALGSWGCSGLGENTAHYL